jgi:hypothetical protein
MVMATFTDEMFECVFCDYSTPVMVRDAPGGIPRALASARCPHCHRRSGAGPLTAVLTAFGISIPVTVLAFAILMRIAIRGHLASWLGNWMFGAAIACGTGAALVILVRMLRDLGRVRFAKVAPLPMARTIRA